MIFHGANYYYCYQGVWFGQVCRTVRGWWRKRFPRRSTPSRRARPSHHVTYVIVEEDDEDNDEWVTFAYIAGYTGLMIGWGCAVWGSGWYYPPYAYGGIYYPHFHSYGYSADYNPWTGAYGRGAVAYGPYGGMGAGARYNPRTGTYSRGAAAWGPYGAAGAGPAYNPRTGAVRHDPAGLERLRQLGIDRRPARRRLGGDQSRHQSRDGHHHANDADRRWRSGHPQPSRCG